MCAVVYFVVGVRSVSALDGCFGVCPCEASNVDRSGSSGLHIQRYLKMARIFYSQPMFALYITRTSAPNSGLGAFLALLECTNVFLKP